MRYGAGSLFGRGRLIANGCLDVKGNQHGILGDPKRFAKLIVNAEVVWQPASKVNKTMQSSGLIKGVLERRRIVISVNKISATPSPRLFELLFKRLFEQPGL